MSAADDARTPAGGRGTTDRPTTGPGTGQDTRPDPGPDGALSTVLNTGLAAEHAAVYVYGVLGAQTSQSAEPALFAAVQDAYVHHRAVRDRLIRQVRDLGRTPVAAEPAYRVPRRLGTPAAVTRAALAVERGCAETWAWVVAGTTGRLRRTAVEVLTETAVRELVFRGTPETFPGVDEHADR